MMKTKNENDTLVETLRKLDRQQWTKSPTFKLQSRIKKSKLKLISELIENYLERDKREIAEQFGLQFSETKIYPGNSTILTIRTPYEIHKHPHPTINTGNNIIEFNNLITNLFIHHDSNELLYECKDEEFDPCRHLQSKDNAETTFNNFILLKNTWETIKPILYNHDRINMEYATLPLICGSDIYVGISDGNDNKKIRLKTVPHILVHGLIQILDGLSLKYFSICKYEKCRKCIILTTARKIYCTFNNCGSLSSINKQKQKNLEAYKKKDRERKRKAYREKVLAR